MDALTESRHVLSLFQACHPSLPRHPMRTYLISFDIATPERHALAGAIMQLGEAWARPLDTTWYVQSTDRADAVERRLRPYLGGVEGLLIQEVEASALPLNTTLRWFRRRRPAIAEAGDAVPLAA